MKEYIKKFSKIPDFKQQGFDGYIAKIDNDNISITFEDVHKGHDKYCTNTKITHIQYVISGHRKLKINDNIYEVQQNDIIEIPANTKFIFAGEMKLLLIMNPKFDKTTEIVGKDNDLY